MSRILRHVGNKDFKRTRQRQIGEQKELAAQKLKEWKEAEAERKQIEEIARPFKSDWREETQLQENDWTPVAGSIANSSAQTFHYATPNFETGEPIAVNVSGLGGVESVPSTTTIDSGFGDISSVDAPNYSQLGLQGYAPPLGGVQRQTQQSENERIDAEIRKLEEQIKESKAKETAAIDAWNAELRATMDRHGREWEAVLKKDGVYNPEKHKGLQARHDAEIEAIWSKEPKTEPYETERQNLRAKIVELEKQRPINQQLDASQQAYPNLPMMNARVSPAAGTLQNSLFDDIEAYDKLTLAQKDAVLKAYARNLKNSTPPPALRDYRNTSPVSGAAMSANLGTAKKIMMDYLTKDWDNRVVADNEYLGRDYIDNQFFPNVDFYPDGKDETHVGGADAVVGTGQPPRVDPKTGEIVVRANFDFKRNEPEAIGDPAKKEYAQRLKRLKYLSDITLRMPDLFDYTLDTMMDFMPGPLKIPAALPVSAIVAGSKSIGRGNNIPIVIRFTPQELKRKNKKQYDKLVEMGLIKESTFDKIKKYR